MDKKDELIGEIQKIIGESFWQEVPYNCHKMIKDSSQAILKLIHREQLKARIEQCQEIIDIRTHVETSHKVIEEIIEELQYQLTQDNK